MSDKKRTDEWANSPNPEVVAFSRRTSRAKTASRVQRSRRHRASAGKQSCVRQSNSEWRNLLVLTPGVGIHLQVDVRQHESADDLNCSEFNNSYICSFEQHQAVLLRSILLVR